MSIGLALFIAGMVGLVAYRIGYVAGHDTGYKRGRSERESVVRRTEEEEEEEDT
jgi:hypothetical protein